MDASELKRRIIAEIMGREGEYDNNPADSGGETMHGITAEVARRAGYAGPMSALPRSLAEQIYTDRYWNALRLDDVTALSVPIAAELADTGVNMGPGTAGQFLQRALNALNQRSTLYPDLKVDGAIGAGSLAALKAYLTARCRDGGETVLLRALNAMQGAGYIELAERREKDETFVFGWLRNRVVI